MKTKHLLPNRLKALGWWILLPSIFIGLRITIMEWEPDLLNFQLPKALNWNGSAHNNLLNELLGIAAIVGGLIVAFARVKVEDELMTRLRLESLVWAVKWNYIILLLAFVFVYGLSFYWVMIYNMFTVLILFIAKFHLSMRELNRSLSHEK